MKPDILFALPGNEILQQKLIDQLECEKGLLELRQFPDQETYLRFTQDLKGKNLAFLCTLHQPNDKILPLYFLARTAKDLGASKIGLIAPYLAYMRQDKIFHPGEGLTSTYFAQLLSSTFDYLVTVDPHLHRHAALSEIYTIPTQCLHAAPLLSHWISKNIPQALLIGPDSESEQWVKEVAEKARCPFTVLEKIRKGDRQVEVSIPQVEEWKQKTPVLVDDIISTGKTMLATIQHLKKLGFKAPVCLGVHGVFAESAYAELQKAGAQIITTNTIPHKSNQIDISELLKQAF